MESKRGKSGKRDCCKALLVKVDRWRRWSVYQAAGSVVSDECVGVKVSIEVQTSD